MKRDEWFTPKFRWLRKSAIAFIIGVIAFALGGIFNAEGFLKALLFGLFFLTALPFVFCLVMIPVLHWKDRYIGAKSTTWGAFLVLETSGWSKIVYWFRHVIPDYNKSWRYRDLD